MYLNDHDYEKILRLVPQNPGILSTVLGILPATKAQSRKAEKVMSQHKTGTGFIDEKIRQKIETQMRWKWKNGNEIPKMIENNKLTMSEDTKQYLVDAVMGKLPLVKFYPYARRLLLPNIISFIHDEHKAIQFLNKNHSLMDGNEVDKLLAIIPDGLDNHLLTIGGAKVLRIRELRQLDLNDSEERHKFINTIAQTPSMISKVGIKLDITHKDLERLPPARRFNFLQHLYEPRLGHMWVRGSEPRYYGNLYLNRLKKAEGHARYKWFSIEDLSVDDMKHLLFAVSIRKNAVMKLWIERYEAYLNLKPRLPSSSVKQGVAKAGAPLRKKR